MTTSYRVIYIYNVRCRWDISPNVFGKTPMEYHNRFFVRQNLVTIIPRQQKNQDS